MSTNPYRHGRAGFELAGAPMGAGSALSVRRAVAIAGQVVRVVYSQEPRHASSAGVNDALNGALYQVNVVSGTGAPVGSVGVSATVVPYPAYGVFLAGEFGCDVALDRPLIVGMTYQIAVSVALVSASGLPVGFPYLAEFVGAARPALVRQMRRKPGMVDLASDPIAGGIIVSGGDWASHQGVPSTRKRCLRRALTGLGAFACLPSYGVAFDLKQPLTTVRLGTARTDLTQQIQQEPDVSTSQTSVVADARGFVTITILANTSEGQDLTATVTASQQGVSS